MASEGEKERDVKKVMRTDGGRLGGGRCLCQLSLFIRYLYHLISAPFTAPQTLQCSYVMHYMSHYANCELTL